MATKKSSRTTIQRSSVKVDYTTAPRHTWKDSVSPVNSALNSLAELEHLDDDSDRLIEIASTLSFSPMYKLLLQELPGVGDRELEEMEDFSYRMFAARMYLAAEMAAKK